MNDENFNKAIMKFIDGLDWCTSLGVPQSKVSFLFRQNVLYDTIQHVVNKPSLLRESLPLRKRWNIEQDSTRDNRK